LIITHRDRILIPVYSPYNSNLVNRSGDNVSTPPGVQGNPPIGGSGGPSFQTQYEQERQNDGQVNLLAERVSALKSITLQIGNEVQDQNRFLGGMTQDFDRTRGLLSSTMGRLQRMMATQDSRYTCYMMFFVVFVIMVLYWLISWRSK
jgi:blocked-early-in-transport protein 1